MKKLSFLFVSLIISLLSFSQTITIDIKECQPFVKWEKTTDQNVLSSPEWSGYKEQIDVKYVIDLDNMTSTIYRNGKLYNVSTIKHFKIEGSKILIDFNAETESTEDIKFEASFTINEQKNTMSVTWYNHYGNYTRTELSTNVKITKKINLKLS